MGEDEMMVLMVSIGLAGGGAFATRTGLLHPLWFRDNPWPGLVRVAVAAAMAWVTFVLLVFADPSVRGVYLWMYLIMGYAVVKVFGQLGAGWFAGAFAPTICERRNGASAVLTSAFTIGTGVLFGSSMWGEADPGGDDEGGWWIPVGFFLMGYVTLVVALTVFGWREGGLYRRIVGDRDRTAARTAAAYTLSTAWIVGDALAGDFYGWWHGGMALAAVVAMLAVHEVSATIARSVGGRRWLETLVYLAAALVVPLLGRLFWWLGGSV